MPAELLNTTYIAVIMLAFLSVFTTLLGVTLAIYIGKNERAIAAGIGFSAGIMLLISFAAKKVPGAVGGKGRMIPLPERQQIVQWVEEASTAGARADKACELLGIAPRTLQRWRCKGELLEDARRTRCYVPANKLSEEEREQIIAVANRDEFAHLPPSQIVPQLADRGEYIASESTFYRVLREAGQLQHRQASHAAAVHKPRPLEANAPNQVYSWDITYCAPSPGRRLDDVAWA